MPTKRASATTAVEAPAPVLRFCRCRRPLEEDRSVYCSARCIEEDDTRATRLGEHLVHVRSDLETQRVAYDAELARVAAEARRVLVGAEENVARLTAELGPLKGRLAEAQAAGEVRWDLASDKAPRAGVERFA